MLPLNSSKNLAKFAVSKMFLGARKEGEGGIGNKTAHCLTLLQGRFAKRLEPFPPLKHHGLIASWKEECSIITNHRASFVEEEEDGSPLPAWEDRIPAHGPLLQGEQGGGRNRATRDCMEVKRLKFYFLLLNEASLGQLCNEDEEFAEQLSSVQSQIFLLLMKMMNSSATKGSGEETPRLSVSTPTMDQVSDACRLLFVLTTELHPSSTICSSSSFARTRGFLPHC